MWSREYSLPLAMFLTVCLVAFVLAPASHEEKFFSVLRDTGSVPVAPPDDSQVVQASDRYAVIVTADLFDEMKSIEIAKGHTSAASMRVIPRSRISARHLHDCTGPPCLE
jgi:hypothetical protein